MNLSNSDGVDDSNEAVKLRSLMTEKVPTEFPTVRKSDVFDDSSIEADELSSMMMEKAEFLTAVRIKSKKSVHFSGIVESHESDKTQEEVELTWLTRYEIDVIRATNDEIKCLISVDHPSLASCDQVCARGLEHRHPNRFKERKLNRRNAVRAVMEEQAHQFEASMTDLESMSHEYRQLTLISQLEARERGRNDAIAAAAIVGPPSSPRAMIKKSFKVPRFFKGLLSEHFKRVHSQQTRCQLLCSPDVVDKLESGSSVSSCKVHEIVEAL